MFVTRDLHHSQFNDILNGDGMVVLQPKEEEEGTPIYVFGVIET